ncbi:MAG: hypothetical protein PWQ50_653, partial [Methanolobus sp.]|nr:hypothetical protein [Methanolobus sp.]
MNEELITYADDGHKEYLETIKSPMYDSTGKLIGVLGIGRDISERKMSEEKLKLADQNSRRTQKILQEVIESPKEVIIFALDKNYRYITFNKNHQMTMKNIWNVEIDIGACMLDYIKESSDKEKAKQNYDRVLAGEAFTSIEEYGDYLLELELLRKEMQLRTAQSVGNVGSWEIDPNTRKVDASEEARKIYGLDENRKYTVEDIREMPLPEYHPMLDKAMTNLIHKNLPY